jgi:hypothetical protein
MAETPCLGLFGYTVEGCPFMDMGEGGRGVESTEQAKNTALHADLREFILIPRSGQPSTHMGYLRHKSAKGGYKKVHTRIAAFKHLPHNRNTCIPTDEELETGEKSG